MDRADRHVLLAELLVRYSNLQPVLDKLLDVLARIEAGDRTDLPGVQSVINPNPARPLVRDRLTEDDVRQLVARFQAGTPKRVLAVEYGIGVSSVKRLVRNHRQP